MLLLRQGLRLTTALVVATALSVRGTALSDELITLVKLDDTSGNIRWSVMNDPVMGGQSHSKLMMNADGASFAGLCAIVPFLRAPGFCKIASETGFFHPHKFPDVSHFISGSLYLEVRSTTPTYAGFKVAFSAKNVTRPRKGMHHAGPSFKANFSIGESSTAHAGDWTTVKVPFATFSVDWSEFTGNCNTKDPTGEQHLCCSAAHPEVCPQDYHLRQLTGFEVWAEGVEGQFAIDVKSIAAGP